MDVFNEARERKELLRQAMLASNLTALDELVNECWSFTGPDGSVFGREQDLGARRAGSLRLSYINVEDVSLNIIGVIILAAIREILECRFAEIDWRGLQIHPSATGQDIRSKAATGCPCRTAC